jgi:uncharacterized membrane protein YkgB
MEHKYHLQVLWSYINLLLLSLSIIIVLLFLVIIKFVHNNDGTYVLDVY